MALCRRLLCFILILTLSFSTYNISFAGEEYSGNEDAEEEREPVFNDIEDHWARDFIENWAANGIIGGYMGYFRPDEEITIAEFSSVLVNLMNYQTMAVFNPERHQDLNEDAWYFEAMLKIHAAGVLGPINGRMNPNSALTRELCAVMLARAFRLPLGAGRTTFRDNSEINMNYRIYVRAMHDAGYVSGYPFLGGHSFRPRQAVTRAEAVAMFSSMAGTLINEPGSVFTGHIDGNLLVTAPDVTLSRVSMGERSKALITEAATGLILDDVTANRRDNEFRFMAEGDVKINNSRVFRLVVDVPGQDISIDITGASNIVFIDMRSGGRIMANQNEFHSVRSVVISEDLRDGHLVTLEGNFQTLTNRKDASAVDTSRARLDVTPSPTSGENELRAHRPSGESLTVEISSRVLGTAHVMVVAGEDFVPTNNEVMFRTAGGDVVAVGDFRVFQGNTDSFEFRAFGRDLTIHDQGHVVHVVIEDEQGRMERLQSELIFFEPEVVHLRITSPTQAVANLSHPFPTPETVEAAFDLFIRPVGGEERQVEFRAFNVISDPEIRHISQTYNLVILYGDELPEEGDVLIMRSVTGGSATVVGWFPNHENIVNLTAQVAVNGNVDISGGVTGPTELFWVLSTEYIPNFHELQNAIVDSRFPVPSGSIRQGRMEFTQAGPFDFFEFGLPNTGFYYLYIFAGHSETRQFCPVQMLVLPVI